MAIPNARALHRFGSGALVLSVAAWALPALAQPGSPQEDLSGFRAKPGEIGLLPRYCWGTFDAKYRGPGMEAFNLPRGCGERFNHFCPGVLSLARANTSVGNSQRRSYWLGVADDHMRYTVNGIKDFPACPLRGTVDAMVQQIHMLKGMQRK